MSRAWRIEYEGALYHVLSRGNERHDIVISDTDRKLFLDTVLSRAAGRRWAAVHHRRAGARHGSPADHTDERVAMGDGQSFRNRAAAARLSRRM